MKEKVISLIDSEYMREFLRQRELSVYEYRAIITGAPVSLAEKAELLSQLLNVTADDREQETVKGLLEAVNKALERLYQADGEHSLLLLLEMDTDCRAESVSGAVPFLSYESMLRYIQKEYWGEEEECDEEDSTDEEADFYFVLELYDKIGDDLIESYEYICNSKGEVQYFKRWGEEKRPDYDNAFSNNSMEYMLVPYQAGDVLYIDCRPYLSPVYCLITYVSSELPRDCCGVRCLYLDHGGVVSESSLKHGHFYPFNSYFNLYCPISPLYRAELYTGELLSEYAFMRPISDMLKKSPENSGKLDALIRDYTETVYIETVYRRTVRDNENAVGVYGITEKNLEEIMEQCIKKESENNRKGEA